MRPRVQDGVSEAPEVAWPRREGIPQEIRIYRPTTAVCESIVREAIRIREGAGYSGQSAKGHCRPD